MVTSIILLREISPDASYSLRQLGPSIRHYSLALSSLQAWCLPNLPSRPTQALLPRDDFLDLVFSSRRSVESLRTPVITAPQYPSHFSRELCLFVFPLRFWTSSLIKQFLSTYYVLDSLLGDRINSDKKYSFYLQHILSLVGGESG